MSKRPAHLEPWITYARVPGLRGLHVIALRYKEAIVIPVTYADDLPPFASLICKLDAEGNGLARIALEGAGCEFFDDDDGESIMAAEAADAELLRFARG